MFATIGRTWGLFKASFGILQKDRELIFLPLLSFVVIAVVAAVFAALALAAGSFDRLSADEAKRQVELVDVVLGVVFVVLATYAGIFFNAALVAAAMERLRGGNPTVGSGLSAVLPYAHNIFGWAVITASVGIVLRVLRMRSDNFLSRLALDLVGGIWAYVTFFVVPVLVVQGLSPIGAIKESGSLFRRTWGEQVTANFGFGLFYIVAFLPAVAVGMVVAAVNLAAGVIVGVLLVALATAFVAAMEGIFKAALYQYATDGVAPRGFEQEDLGKSYQRVF
ncbi:MAG: DUF6159 family protein [Dehalococcoidia bacterium]